MTPENVTKRMLLRDTAAETLLAWTKFQKDYQAKNTATPTPENVKQYIVEQQPYLAAMMKAGEALYVFEQEFGT